MCGGLSLRSIVISVALAACVMPAAAQKATPARKLQQQSTPSVNSSIQPGAPKNAPKLGVVVRVPVGKQLPTALRKYALTDGAHGASRLQIEANDQESINAALQDPDLHVEFVRPKVITPLLQIAPENIDARISHRVPEFEADFAAIRGRTVKVAVFDQGRIRDTHQEFQDAGVSWLTTKTAKALARHSTHCAGTIGAKGVQLQATGMATQVRLFSYDWDNDLTNLNNDASLVGTGKVKLLANGPLEPLLKRTSPTDPAAQVKSIMVVGAVALEASVIRTRHEAGAHVTNRAAAEALLLICISTCTMGLHSHVGHPSETFTKITRSSTRSCSSRKKVVSQFETGAQPKI